MKKQILLIILFSIIFSTVNAQLKRQFICHCRYSDGGDGIYIDDFETKFVKNQEIENNWEIQLNGRNVYGISLCVQEKEYIKKLELTILDNKDSIIFFANNQTFDIYNYGNPFEYNYFRFITKTSGTYKMSLKLTDKIEIDYFDALITLSYINKNK